MELENKIRDIQKIDPLSVAENLTGKSYKESKSTGFLGLGLQMEKNRELNKLLTAADDTLFSETESEYLRKVKDFGFELILTEPFKGFEGQEERLHILWHPQLFILICFDTFTWTDRDGSFAAAGRPVPEPGVNGGNIYYTWVPNDVRDRDGTSSGGFTSHVNPETLTVMENPESLPEWGNGVSYEDFKPLQDSWNRRNDEFIRANGLIYIWTGHYDCREGVKNHIKLLSGKGTFIKWIKPQFLWLLNYMDSKTPDYDYRKINLERIVKLPQSVQDCLMYDKF